MVSNRGSALEMRERERQRRLFSGGGVLKSPFFMPLPFFDGKSLNSIIIIILCMYVYMYVPDHKSTKGFL